MAFGPITSWQIDGETMVTVTDFILLCSKITADGDCSPEIKRHLLLEGRRKWQHPLQYSCLENPRDRGAWWAAICGVAQSRTRRCDLAAAAAAPWKKCYDQPRQRIKKQRHYFANKGPYSQSHGFSSCHV